MKRLLSLVILTLVTAVAGAQIVPRMVIIENDLLTYYLDHSDYNPDDYSYTNIFLPAQRQRWDSPAPVVFRWKENLEGAALEIREHEFDPIPFQAIEIKPRTKSCQVYNLIPGRWYFYTLVDARGNSIYEKGSFFVNGRRRMIRADNVRNIRDFGGMVTDDGRTLRYGLMYRGACLDWATRGGQVDTIFTRDGWKVLHDLLKIRADIDLRSPLELNLTDDDPSNDMDKCPLGPDVEHHHYSMSAFGGIQTSGRYGPALLCILDCLQRGRNVFIHCAAGADRTGAISFLLGGMAGVCETDLARDYELTCMSKSTPKHTRNSDKPYYYAASVAYLKENFEGNTLSEKIQDFLIKKQGITREQITALQEIMVGDQDAPR